MIPEFLSYYHNLRYRLESEDLALDIKANALANNVELKLGQKRVVIDDPTSANHVWKLAISPEGIVDNKNDLLTSFFFKLYPDILNKAQGRIILSQIVFPGNPTIIRCDKVSPAEFNNSVRQYMTQNNLSGLKEGIISHMCSSPTYLNDINIAVSTIMEFCEGADFDPSKEPDNYGLRTINNETHYCLLDIGSVVPKIEGFQVTCSHCGHPLKYNIATLFQNSPLINNMPVRGHYTCTNPTCTNNVANRTSNMLPEGSELIDTNVFAKYCQMAYKPLEGFRVLASYEFNPPTLCPNLQTYQQALQTLLDPNILNLIDNEKLQLMWQEYCRRIQYFSMIKYVTLIQSFNPLNVGINQPVPYGIYQQKIFEFLATIDNSLNPQTLMQSNMMSYIHTAYARWMRGLLGVQSPVNLAQITPEAIQSQFVQIRGLVPYLDEQSIMLIINNR